MSGPAGEDCNEDTVAYRQPVCDELVTGGR